MNLAGYLIVISSLQQLSKLKDPIQDIFFRIDTLSSLSNHLNTMNIPLQGFRDTCIQSRGDVTLYISQNLKDYIIERKGHDSEEGFIMKIIHGPPNSHNGEKYDALSYFIHDEKINDAGKREVFDKFKQFTKEQKKKGLLIDNVKTIYIN